MQVVKALCNLWHNASAHCAGETFDVSDALAEQLRQAGLVDIVEEPKPQPVEQPKPEPGELQRLEDKPVEAEPVKRQSRKKAKK